MSDNSAYWRDDIDYLFELLEQNEPEPGNVFDITPEMFQEESPSNLLWLEERRKPARSIPDSLIATTALIAISTLVALLLLLGNSGVKPIEVVETLPSPTATNSALAAETPEQMAIRRYSSSGLVFDGVYFPVRQESQRNSYQTKPLTNNSTYSFWQW